MDMTKIPKEQRAMFNFVQFLYIKMTEDTPVKKLDIGNAADIYGIDRRIEEVLREGGLIQNQSYNPNKTDYRWIGSVEPNLKLAGQLLTKLNSRTSSPKEGEEERRPITVNSSNAQKDSKRAYKPWKKEDYDFIRATMDEPAKDVAGAMERNTQSIYDARAKVREMDDEAEDNSKAVDFGLDEEKWRFVAKNINVDDSLLSVSMGIPVQSVAQIKNTIEAGDAPYDIGDIKPNPPVEDGGPQQAQSNGNSGEPWTEDDDNYIRENYQKITDDEIAEHLQRTADAVGKRRLDLGLKKPRGQKRRMASKNTPWTKKEDEFLLAHANKKTAAWIAKHLDGRTSAAVKGRIYYLGIGKTKGRTKHNQPSSRMPWSDTEMEVLVSNYMAKSDIDIGRMIGRTTAAVKTKRMELGLTKRKDSGKFAPISQPAAVAPSTPKVKERADSFSLNISIPKWLVYSILIGGLAVGSFFGREIINYFIALFN